MAPRSSLKSTRWYRAPAAPKPPGAAGAVARVAIGAAVGALFFAGGLRTMASVVWGITAIVGGAAVASPAARLAIDRLLAAFGSLVGRGLAMVLLAPVHLVGLTLVRVFSRIGGRDPLRLRASDAPSFWLPSDADARKVAHAGAAFVTEARGPGGRPFVTAAAALAGLLIVAEIGLRAFGFGHPVLYVDDARMGYMPAPAQAVRRYGGAVSINAFGMRAPDYPAEKPAGALRVLMLGDSTLFGGSYVDQDDLYARRVEQALRRRTGREVQVLNMGVNGWGPFHEAGYVDAFGTFGADVAVITLPILDVQRPLSRLSAVPYMPAAHPPRLALEEVAYHLTWRWRERVLGKPDAAEAERRSEQGVAAYVALARRLRAAGAEVLVEVLPSQRAGLGHAPEWEQTLVDRLTAALQAAGVEVGFPVGLFAARGPARALYHDNVHLDTLGHRHYADYLTERLAARSPRLAASEGASP